MATTTRSRGRLHVSVLAPDGARRSAAGLATWLEAVAPARARGEVSIALVSDRRMRTLNRSFRGVDRATDVLSFPAFAAGSPDDRSRAASADSPGRRSSAAVSEPPVRSGAPIPLGDIVIAAGVAERQATAAGHTMRTEIRVLALHGLLHLLGYDHETDDGAMARIEQRLRRKGQLREGLIERATPARRTARR